jgi:hypothetical protein
MTDEMGKVLERSSHDVIAVLSRHLSGRAEEKPRKTLVKIAAVTIDIGTGHLPNKVYSVATDLINALPGNSSVNKVQHATIEEAVFSVDPTDAPIDRLYSDHVIRVYCRSMSFPRLYN